MVVLVEGGVMIDDVGVGERRRAGILNIHYYDLFFIIGSSIGKQNYSQRIRH